MSALIDTLLKQHIEIMDILDKAQKTGITTQDGKDLLVRGKGLIVSHLQKEDAELYPKLLEFEETKDIGNKFSDDMKGLVPLALKLFQKVESGDTGIETAKLLGKVAANLKMRIQKEESALYPAYNKVAG